MLTTAPMLMTMAAIARALSKPLTVAARTGAGAGAFGFGAVGDWAAEAGREVVAAEVPGREAPRAAAPAGPPVGGRGAAGAGAAGLGPAAAPDATGGAEPDPPGGNDGNRIVAVGFGGKLIRTVSFLG